MMMVFTLNGRRQLLDVDGDRRLLWVLRTDFQLTGTKFGCGHGLCGACTVLVNDRPRPACQVPMTEVAGQRVRTIESLADRGSLHPLQRAFIDHGAFQCGFCTAGMLMVGYALLQRTPHPTVPEIVGALDRNLCRCGAQTRIVAAVQSVARPGDERP
jgi:aerobic-type carbon monoxide dehydrogenase small subunit (CoxS/CutS family)